MAQTLQQRFNLTSDTALLMIIPEYLESEIINGKLGKTLTTSNYLELAVIKNLIDKARDGSIDIPGGLVSEFVYFP